MALSAKAIIDVAFYAMYIREGLATFLGPEKTRVEFLINAASEEILKFLGVTTLITTTSTVEEFDGNGLEKYYPKNGNITAVSKLEYFIGNATWTEITTAQRARSFDADKVWFPDRFYFEEGTRFRLTYSYGSARASIAADIQEACAKLVRMKVQQADRGSELASKSTQSESSSYNYQTARDEIFEALLPHKRVFLG